MLDKIYTVTTMTKLEQDLGWPRFGNTRLVAWYEKFDDAEKCVIYNDGDIWETCYDYAVIEEVEQGLYPYCKNRWFYKFNERSKGYRNIEEPEFMEHFANILKLPDRRSKEKESFYNYHE